MTPAQDCGGEDLTASTYSDAQSLKDSEKGGSTFSDASAPMHEGMKEIVRQCLQQDNIKDAFAMWTMESRMLRKFGYVIPQEVLDHYQDMMIDEFEKKMNRALVNVTSPGNAIAGNMFFNPNKPQG